MIKGVNKHIIEINDPDSLYFERAVFYLRPGVRELPAELGRREIGRCFSKLGISPRRRRPGLRGGLLIAIGLALIAGAVVMMSLS
ncbi:MAG: hypothetical protein IJ071_00155 [Ruminococcus sp.]|nr:hypothetical protein [Ruminococcus sp.]